MSTLASAMASIIEEARTDSRLNGREAAQLLRNAAPYSTDEEGVEYFGFNLCESGVCGLD